MKELTNSMTSGEYEVGISGPSQTSISLDFTQLTCRSGFGNFSRYQFLSEGPWIGRSSWSIMFPVENCTTAQVSCQPLTLYLSTECHTLDISYSSYLIILPAPYTRSTLLQWTGRATIDGWMWQRKISRRVTSSWRMQRGCTRISIDGKQWWAWSALCAMMFLGSLTINALWDSSYYCLHSTRINFPQLIGTNYFGKSERLVFCLPETADNPGTK